MSFFHSLLVERLDFLAVEADVCVRFVPILITNAGAFLFFPKALNIRKWCFNPHQISEFTGSQQRSHANVTLRCQVKVSPYLLASEPDTVLEIPSEVSMAALSTTTIPLYRRSVPVPSLPLRRYEHPS